MPKPYLLLLILLLLPLLLINVKESHDWGDDFAQYLIQAKNIIEGKPQKSTLLQFDENSGNYAVKAYPVGFPLLLSPLVAISGISIKPLLILESVLLISLTLLCFLYFKTFFSPGLSFLLSVFLAYHFQSLNLKAQVLSEIPFSLTLVAIALLFNAAKTNMRLWFLCAILCAILASIRIVGLLIIPATGAYLLYNYLSGKNEEGKKFSLKIFLILSLVSSAFFLFLNSILFDFDIRDFGGFYQDVLTGHQFSLTKNLAIYIEQIGAAFALPGLHISIWGIISSCLVLIGFIRTFLKRNGIVQWFVVFYLLILCLYPYTSGGFRFLFPVFPFLIIYFVEGLSTLIKVLSKSSERKIIYVIVSLLLLQQLFNLKHTWTERSQLSEGPQSPHAVEMFDYIRHNTGPTDLLVFPRARAMALYTGRPVSYLLQQKSVSENADLFNRLKVQYLILPKKNEQSPLFDAALSKYVSLYTTNLQTQWVNEEFVVYKVIP
ncbi:MAG: hypothetical protein EYC69_09220 [Bacteroidetes bacterium]|nr:MAG: hypothetical protein EYC69_09220 [Bacteroidota bacterium]